MPPAHPIVPGAPPPEPVKPKIQQPTEQTIEEARRRSAEAEQAAGPAVERFQLTAPDHTPEPGPLPSGPRIEYVEIKGSEELPDAVRKRRRLLIMVGVGVGLVALIVGNVMGRSSVRSSLNESVLLEAKEKRALLDAKQPTFESIAVIRSELEKIDTAVRLLDPEEGDITALEEDFADLVAVMKTFADNKQSSLELEEVIGSNVVNGELMRRLASFAFETKSFHMAVDSAVEEAMAMFKSNMPPPPDRQKLLVVAEPDALEVEGLGKVPLSKGTLVVIPGRPEAIQTKDASGQPITEFYQKVKLEGRDTPIQIKTTQMVQVDMAPWWEKSSTATKRTILTRLAGIAANLYDQVKKLDVKPIKAAVQEIIDRAE
jgi:hypothetical protein